MIIRTGKRTLLLGCALITAFLLSSTISVSGQNRDRTRDTIGPYGDDAVRKMLKEKNPDFDKQLQEHETEVQKKLAEKQKTDSPAQKKKSKKRKVKKKIRR